MKESLRRISELVQRERVKERKQMAVEAEGKSKPESGRKQPQKRDRNKVMASAAGQNAVFVQKESSREFVAP